MSDLLDLIEKALQAPVPKILLWAMIAFVVLYGILQSLSFLHREIIPIFYNAEEARRRRRRQRFAEHIEHELRRLDSIEEWSDYRFTELEAEVEAQGHRRHRLLPFLTKRDSLRRESSLTKALENSAERLILVEGAPGSGKSVALRHVAQKMACEAMRSRSLKTVIPVYVNLKSLKHDLDNTDGHTSVDAEFIRKLVIQSLNRANDRDVTSYLEDEFQTGLNEGTWLFLFDSFDEVPEILSSTEADSVIRVYAQAISDFLHGMNRCRGIIASREYRGPRYLTWSKFRIMPLSPRQQEELVKRAELPLKDETAVIGALFSDSPSVHQLAHNPMFLGLLCEYVRVNHHYPDQDFAVYEAYLANRLVRDEERLRQRFGLSSSEVRQGAESIAFCMLCDGTLGLSATRSDIHNSLLKHGFVFSFDTDQVLSALQFIKLARVEETPALRSQQTFTFSHRRLQETLATMVLHREPQRVAPYELLTSGIWRESTVSLLQQASSAAAVEPLLHTAILTIVSLWAPIENQFEDEGNIDSNVLNPEVNQLPRPFPWPQHLRHILELLHDGLVNRPELVPSVLRTIYGIVIASLWKADKWLIFDMRDALAVAGMAPQELLSNILTLSLEHPSRLIRDTAYRRAAMLRSLEPDHVQGIRNWLVEMNLEGRLQREYKSVIALIMRLDQSRHLLDVVRFLRAIPLLSLLMGVAVTGIVLTVFPVEESKTLRLLAGLALLSPFIIRLFGWLPRHRLFVVLSSLIGFSSITWLWARQIEFNPLAIVYFYVLTYGYLYALALWGFWAKILAYRGAYVRLYEWPIAMVISFLQAPLWLLKDFSERTTSLAKESIQDFLNSWKAIRSELGAARTFILSGSMIAFLVAFTWFLFSPTIPLTYRYAGNWILLLIAPIIMIIQMIETIRPDIRDRGLIKDVMSRNTRIPVSEMLQTVAIFRWNESRLRYMSLIRERQLLLNSEEGLPLLRGLAAQSQYDLYHFRHDSKLDEISSHVLIPESNDFGQWYLNFLKQQRTENKNRKYRFGLAEFGWEFLDEVILLLKQVEDSQRLNLL